MGAKLGDFILLYGSQTGQAKAIAENIAERSERLSLNARLHCLSGTEKQFSLEKERVAIFVISTTGDGDFPETASKFCRRLNKKDLPAGYLKNLAFALLGLGDTNYNNFCASPKKVEKRLLELGATKFYDTAFCDDAVGTELTAEPWMENLLPSLKMYLGIDSNGETKSAENGIDSAQIIAPATPRASVDDLVTEFVSKCDLKDSREAIGSHETDGSCRCVWPTPSLLYNEKLGAEADLKVPMITAPYLTIEYLNAENEKESMAPELQYPSQGSSIFSATLVERRQVTAAGAKKDKFEVTMEFEASNAKYEPGDAFYFVIPNVAEEVYWLLRRLKLLDSADKTCAVRVVENTTRKNAKLPPYLERLSSLRYIFMNLIDLRRFLSKGAIRYLAECCTCNEDKRRLLELVSTQGVADYEEYIRNASLSILDVLHAFPSCIPAVERLFEYLPQLQPRPYSVANYGNQENGGKCRVRFVYSLVSIPAAQGRFYSRDGLATGLLTKCPIGQQLKMFMKKPGKFRLVRDHNDCPLLMVGPGTGVAPFIGFLDFIRTEKQSTPHSFPNNWLFFGCRNEKLDFLFRDQLESFQTTGTLNHFHITFSRDDESSPNRYVQDLIRRKGEELSKLILGDQKVRIYVCGDARHMAVDVFKAFCDILSTHGGKTEEDAVAFCRKMQEDNRYVQDVWT